MNPTASMRRPRNSRRPAAIAPFLLDLDENANIAEKKPMNAPTTMRVTPTDWKLPIWYGLIREFVSYPPLARGGCSDQKNRDRDCIISFPSKGRMKLQASDET